MAKTIKIDGVSAIMHFNSSVASYEMALKMGPSNSECCFCGNPVKLYPPKKPGDSISGLCPICKRAVEYVTIVLSKEFAEYFDVRGGTATGKQLGIGGVMHIVLPKSHPEFDNLLGKIFANDTDQRTPTNLLSNMNPETALLLGIFGIFDVRPLIMNYGNYYLFTLDIPENDKPKASKIKAEMRTQANRLMKEGYEHLEQSQFEKAEYCFNQISAWFYEPKAYLALALSLLNQGKFEDGEKWLRMTIEIDPQNSEAYFQLGNILDERPNGVQEAERCYRKVLELDNQHIWANNNLGLLLRHQRRFQEAITYVRKCVSLTQDSRLYENLGLTLSDTYQYVNADPNLAREAEKALLTAIRLNPQSPKIYSNLAYLYMLVERYAESEQTYKKAIKIDPSFAPAYSNMCTLLQMVGRNKEAQEYRKKAVSIDPTLARRS